MFFGGSKDVYERDKAFLSDIGEVFYLGDVKAACAFKLITNLIGLSNNVILTEGVFLARGGASPKRPSSWGEVHRRVVLPDAELGHKVFAKPSCPCAARSTTLGKI